MSLARNFHPPRRRNQRFRQGHFHGQGIAQVEVRQRVGHQHGQRVCFLAGGAPCTPDADRILAPRGFLLEQLFDHRFLKEIELCLVAKETGFVDRQIFEQLG